MKNYMISGNGLHRIGRLIFTRLPKDVDNNYLAGDDFRLGWMTGITITSFGQWVIWWRKS